MPTLSTRNELSSQLQAMDSFLDMASEFDLVDSNSNGTPVHKPNSVTTAQLVLDISSTIDHISEAEKQLRVIQKLQLSGEIKCNSIDGRIDCLQTFADQIALILQNRGQLLNKLSQPRPAHYIVMDYQYQKDFVQLITTIKEEIPKLQESLDTISWKDRFFRSSNELEQLESTLEELSKLLLQQIELADTTERLQSSLKSTLNRSK